MSNHTRNDILRRIASSGRVDVSGADLSGLDLSGLTLVGADLSYADLSGADLSNAQLPGASLWSVRARAASFQGANLGGANLGLALLGGANLRGAQLDHADMTGAQLDGADLTGARMRGVWLDTMQRALAVGAPPLRFPDAPRQGTRVLRHDDVMAPVILRCGDKLELRLTALPRRTGIAQNGLQAGLVLTGPEQQRDGSVLTYAAVSPGSALIRVWQAEGLPLLVVDVTVMAS